jgi:hypothetical protein
MKEVFLARPSSAKPGRRAKKPEKSEETALPAASSKPRKRRIG